LCWPKLPVTCHGNLFALCTFIVMSSGDLVELERVPCDLEILRGGVAVVTGAASGIGFALAKACRVSYKMHVVLSDIRVNALLDAVGRMRSEVVESDVDLRVESFLCDVVEYEEVERLLEFTQNCFPECYIQFLGANAGVMLPETSVLTGTAEAWEFMHRVNVLGVVHVLRAFVPLMNAQSVRSIVEVTSSAFGVVPGMRGPYGSSKLAALGVAEAVYYELKILQAVHGVDQTNIGFVALCPTTVNADIIGSTLEVVGDRLHTMAPKILRNDGRPPEHEKLRELISRGMHPDLCAEEVFQHAAKGQFYCILDNDVQRDGVAVGVDRVMKARAQAMLARDVPPPLPTHKGPWGRRKLNLNELRGGVAVVTGAAAGIGFALGKECVAVGMHVVLSDVRLEKLQEAVLALQSSSGKLRVEGFRCDVTRIEDVRALLEFTQAAFQDTPIQFVGANAGVLLPRVTVFTGTTQEWEYTYRVNVLGAVNVLQVFLPRLAMQSERSILEVTASGFGVVPGLRGGSVGVAEAAFYELKRAPSNPLDRISLVVLSPAVVNTNIIQSSVECSPGLSCDPAPGDAASKLQVDTFKKVIASGMPPEVCAKAVFRHAQRGQFYCLQDNDPVRDGFSAGTDPMVKARMEAILARGTPPVPRALSKGSRGSTSE